jgi:hypothetical protein
MATLAVGALARNPLSINMTLGSLPPAAKIGQFQTCSRSACLAVDSDLIYKSNLIKLFCCVPACSSTRGRREATAGGRRRTASSRGGRTSSGRSQKAGGGEVEEGHRREAAEGDGAEGERGTTSVRKHYFWYKILEDRLT